MCKWLDSVSVSKMSSWLNVGVGVWVFNHGVVVMMCLCVNVFRVHAYIYTLKYTNKMHPYTPTHLHPYPHPCMTQTAIDTRVRSSIINMVPHILRYDLEEGFLFLKALYWNNYIQYCWGLGDFTVKMQIFEGKSVFNWKFIK